MSARGPAIELPGLRRRLPGKEVLQGIDLEIAPGTVVG